MGHNCAYLLHLEGWRSTMASSILVEKYTKSLWIIWLPNFVLFLPMQIFGLVGAPHETTPRWVTLLLSLFVGKLGCQVPSFSSLRHATFLQINWSPKLKIMYASAIVQWLVSPPVTRETGVRFPVAEETFFINLSQAHVQVEAEDKFTTTRHSQLDHPCLKYWLKKSTQPTQTYTSH